MFQEVIQGAFSAVRVSFREYAGVEMSYGIEKLNTGRFNIAQRFMVLMC